MYNPVSAVLAGRHIWGSYSQILRDQFFLARYMIARLKLRYCTLGVRPIVVTVSDASILLMHKTLGALWVTVRVQGTCTRVYTFKCVIHEQRVLGHRRTLAGLYQQNL